MEKKNDLWPLGLIVAAQFVTLAVVFFPPLRMGMF
jgi:hypothetical protein